MGSENRELYRHLLEIHQWKYIYTNGLPKPTASVK